jgi:hypothetical protein
MWGIEKKKAHCVNSCSHRCLCWNADRAHAGRAGRPVAKEARERQRGRRRLKQRYQTMPDNLCTFHLFSLVLVASPLSSPFPRSTLAPPLFCSFSVPRSRPRSSSRALTLPCSSRLYSLLVSILFNLPHRCSVATLLSHTRCTNLATTPSLPRPRCVILAVPHSLPHPRCLTLTASPCSNLSSSHPSHCWL